MTEDEIKARLAAATPGPWFARPNDLIGGWCVRTADTPPSEGPGEVADFIREEDARLISAAPTDIEALIAEVERLRAEIARTEQIVADNAHWFRTQERERIVAWLRERQPGWPAGSGGHADAIERGEHNRDAKPFAPSLDVAHAEAPDAEHCACVPALRAEIERLRTNADARERVMRREADLLRAAQRDVDVLRKEVHELRLWAEEAARAENANAEDAKKERAAVVAWLREHWSEVLEQTPQQTARLIERGEHRREEER